MRWESQRAVGEAEAAAQPLPGMPGLVRTVRSPEFAGMVFHEVLAKSVLNEVPGGSPLPFRFTVNTFRGCSHACRYCFARNSHTYLDFNAGDDFDRQVVVKLNVAEVLAAQLQHPRWQRSPVAMGTNTDPYQRAEGRYRLMPGVISAFVQAKTPFSVLTKGTLLHRDLPLLASAAERVEVGVGVSLALLDPQLQRSLEPGTPAPRARLELIRALAEAGLPCSVFVAPVLPHLTDSVAALDALLGEVAAAGASGVAMVPLHLRPGTRQWFLRWLAETRPDLLRRYEQLYSGGAYVDTGYRRLLAQRWGPLLRRHGLTSRVGRPAATAASVEPQEEVVTNGEGPEQPTQLTLL